VDDCCEPFAKTRPFDIAIVGAGSAGFSAAIAAAEEGARVALIGHGVIGGTCVNVGCVPSKALIRATESVRHANEARRFAGVTSAARIDDWRALMAQKTELVGALRQAKYVDLLADYDTVSYRTGRASLAEGGVDVDGALVRASKIIIAAGARPAIPAIPGLEDIDTLTSTTALEIETPPKSLLVLGGGYIGAELAQMFARAGVTVTIVCRTRLLPSAEPEIGAALSGYLEAEGVRVVSGVTYRATSRTDQGVGLRVEQQGTEVLLEAERLLLTAGRTPNTESLGLDAFGVHTRDGAILVDDRMRTSRPGVYAAGDVTGRDQFVYMAAYGAKIAAKNALNDDAFVYDATAMPAVVFTDPQVASVGLTEAQAKAQGRAVATSVLQLEHLPRALAARDTRGLIKLVADRASGVLLGAHILAPEGADSIQTAALAIRQGLTVEDIGQMIFPYLTTVEGIKLAALGFSKSVAKLSCCAG
jgi:mercuric reductase